MKTIIWVMILTIAVLILLWFCFLVYQLSDLVACNNMPFNKLTEHCIEVLR